MDRFIALEAQDGGTILVNPSTICAVLEDFSNPAEASCIQFSGSSVYVKKKLSELVALIMKETVNG